MLFTYIKSWFFRNHLAKFHQISHGSFCWNVIDSLFKWSCSIDCQPIYSSSKLRTAQMMIFSLVAMIGLEKCCITSACLQWLCHSGERIVARGPLVFLSFFLHTWLYLLMTPALIMLVIPGLPYNRVEVYYLKGVTGLPIVISFRDRWYYIFFWKWAHWWRHYHRLDRFRFQNFQNPAVYNLNICHGSRSSL